MKNLFKKIFLTLSMLLCVTLAGTSCDAFFGDDGYLVTSVQVVDNEDGTQTMTIYFDDDSVEPITVTSPKGEDGIGIEGVTSSYDSETRRLTLTINYEDGTTQDVTFSPLNVVEITVENNQEDQITYVTFHYSDGQDQVCSIPYGRGIDDIVTEPIYQTYVDESGEIVEDTSVILGYRVTIVLNDGEGYDPETQTWTTPPTSYSFEIDTKGKQVSNINVETAEDGTYTFTFEYTDGSEPTIISGVEPPHATKWFTMSGAPTDSDAGEVGDLWFDYDDYSIYELTSISEEATEEGGTVTRYTWTRRGQLQSTYGTTACYVYFQKTDDEVWSDDRENATNQKYYRLIQGNRVPTAEIPLLEKAVNPQNYRFLGWFFGDDENNPNIGQFTNLTVVTGSMTLYPRFEAIA